MEGKTSVTGRTGASGARLISVQVGRVARLGPNGVPSAFVKRPVAGPVAVAALGLAGDEQADLRVHGGPEKAVYGYALASYAGLAEGVSGARCAARAGRIRRESHHRRHRRGDGAHRRRGSHRQRDAAGHPAAAALLQVRPALCRQANAQGDDPQRPLRLVLPRRRDRCARRRRSPGFARTTQSRAGRWPASTACWPASPGRSRS